MSWLDSVEREYRYKCESCGDTIICASTLGWPACAEDILCKCGASARYDGFNPTKLNIRGRVAFEHNGRKGYQITDGRGNVRYVSASKEHYLETGDIKPSYTSGFVDHMKKIGQVDQLAKETKRDEIIEARKKHAEISKLATPVSVIPDDV